MHWGMSIIELLNDVENYSILSHFYSIYTFTRINLKSHVLVYEWGKKGYIIGMYRDDICMYICSTAKHNTDWVREKCICGLDLYLDIHTKTLSFWFWMCATNWYTVCWNSDCGRIQVELKFEVKVYFERGWNETGCNNLQWKVQQQIFN